MKITLGTCGSRGDVQPLISLALALKSANHNVLMCAPPEHADWVKSHGCAFRAIGNNIMGYLESHSNTNSLRAFTSIIRFMKGEIAAQLRQLPEIIDGSDLFLGSSLLLGAPTVAESFGVPYRFIAFCPQVMPSRSYPMVHIKNHRLPGWVNRVTWLIFRHADVNFNYRKIINQKRKQLGLTPISDVLSHLLGNDVIIASDALLGAVPKDVEQSYTQIGYLHLDQKGELDADLKRFIHSGTPPVYIGFGSMPSEDPVQTTRLIVKAVRLSEQRAVLSRGWAKLADGDLGDDCFMVGDVLHSTLFPKMAAVVHHGGAGTTATAAKAGVPQIIVPHIMDQFYWAQRIYSKKLGPKPIWRPRLTAERLAQAITTCLSNETFHNNAQQCAKELVRQSPKEQAIHLIETMPCQQTKKIY